MIPIWLKMFMVCPPSSMKSKAPQIARHGKHDDKGVLETFELCRQYQVNKEQGQAKGKYQTRRTFAEFFRVTGQGGTEGFIERLFGYAVHFVKSVANGFTLGGSGRNRGRNKAIVAIEFGGRNAFGQVDKVFHLNHLAVAAAHINGLQVVRVVALLSVNFAHNFVLLSVQVKVAHALSAQSVLQGLCHIARAHPHQVGFVAVYRQAHFGFRELQINVGHAEGGAFVNGCHELGQHFLQFFEVRASSTYCTGIPPRRPPNDDCCCTKARASVWVLTARVSCSATCICE